MSSKLIITEFPRTIVATMPILPVDRVNIHRSVRGYLTPGENLTREKALTIFRDMKWRSQIKAALLNPITTILISTIALPYFMIASTAILLTVALKIGYFVGMCAFCFTLDQIFSGRGWEKAYRRQIDKLSEHITTLESNPSMTVELGPTSREVKKKTEKLKASLCELDRQCPQDQDQYKKWYDERKKLSDEYMRYLDLSIESLKN